LSRWSRQACRELEANTSSIPTTIPKTSTRTTPTYVQGRQEEGGGEVFSSEKSEMDFVTKKGIQTRTSIDPKDFPAFVIKELLDNALDSSEKNYNSSSTNSNGHNNNIEPRINVTVSSSTTTNNNNSGLLNIKVSNSNPTNRPVFTADKVKRIFDFGGSFSSKKNQFKVTRGALGDALKELVWIPYAMAIEDCGLSEWNEPFIISDVTYDEDNNNIKKETKSLVRVIVDKPNQEVRFQSETATKMTTVTTVGAKRT
jgi:hypothetical protein